MAVEMRGITKRFGRFVANDSVDLKVETGSTHAIVGENGAGKTTLMRVLYGYHQPDAGVVLIDGQPAKFRTPADAIAAGIGMVSQHYSIIPELTALDNLLLGAEITGSLGIMKRKEAESRAAALAKDVGLSLEWNQPASDLTPANAQKLEILKLLWRKARILILDEPTAMLSPADSGALFEILERLKAEGRTVLLVTHKMREVLDHADHVTVLRGGKKVFEAPVKEIDQNEITQHIVGEADFHATTEALGQPVEASDALKIAGLRDRSGRLRDFSLTVQQGEMVGIAGVDGNGQVELIELLAGLTTPAAGSIELYGARIERWATATRLAYGLRFLYEDRFRRGMIAEWSVADNAILGAQREPEISKRGWISRQRILSRAQAVVERFGAKTPGLTAPMRELSGGNQQRVVMARALHGSPKVVAAYAPTRGLDVKGSEDAFKALRQAAADGAACLVVSLDLDELFQFCDRIAVIYKGENKGEFLPDQYDREQIGARMVGL